MGPASIYPWRKMHRSRAPSIAPGTFVVAQPWADCITNMPGLNLRQSQVCSLIWLALVGAYRSRASLEAENTILRHQLNVLRRQSPKRPTFGMLDRLIFAGLYRLAPKVLGALAIVKPATVIRWHRAGFRSYWRWKSRRRGGRPTVAPEIRKLIREMSIANPLWGAPRI